MISVKQSDNYIIYVDFPNKRRIPLTSDLECPNPSIFPVLITRR